MTAMHDAITRLANIVEHRATQVTAGRSTSCYSKNSTVRTLLPNFTVPD